ncbi:MAG: AEC family transporter [Mariniphaga sp.]|nr:AEC family transporter [Mariniphaga sp.]
MGTFLNATNSVLPLFLIIILGIVLTRLKVTNRQWIEILNKYALWIGFPALVIYSLMHLKLSGSSYSNLILINSAYIVFCILLAYPIAKIAGFNNQMKQTLFLILCFGNVAYLGIPVLQNTLGESILPVAAIISAVYVFWLFTLAIILVEIHNPQKSNIPKLLLNLLKNPLLISVFIGLAIVFFQVKIPIPVEKTIKLFSDSVTAVVLFSLGIFLGLQEIGKIKEWGQVFFFVILTMIILPATLYLLIKLFNFEDSNFCATILDSAMPLGLTSYVLSVQYNLRVKFVARMIVLATLLSMVIIPLWLVVLK